jgi:hypothetical protein
MSKSALLQELRRALAEMLTLQAGGGLHTKLSVARGFVDGYTRALLDAQLVTHEELLRVINEERAKARGPATAETTGESFAFSRAVA